jgi:tetratricopeptide (TPR) repeat protein
MCGLSVTGLVVDGTGFEVLVGPEQIGARRTLQPADVGFLQELTARYVRAVHARSDPGVFLGLGRELFGWLEGDQGQLSGLLQRAGAPLIFEVRGPRSPSESGWALLRAPFELLTRPGGGFLAEDTLTRFVVVRRLGPVEQPPRPDGFRLGVAFMASSPRGQPELDFEAEEAAILHAVGTSRIDLLVEDTGDPQQLGRRLAEVGGMPTVHVSCHGLHNWPTRPGGPGVPVLMMENDIGEARATTAADLTQLLTVGPRLLFVSACLTATGTNTTSHLPPADNPQSDPNPGTDSADRETVAHSLVTALVTAGVPAVIGWDGSVNDHAATTFAQRLYRGLADRADVAVAVSDARRALLESEDPVLRAEWHLARLWLGPTGGGPLVAGTRKRSLVSATHGTKTFLDRKRQVPVATSEMFVGRRPQLQQALRALRSDERAGVLLHGQGRLGKSSLAARIADRCPDRAVAVVFGDYSALAILDAVADAVRTNPTARNLITQQLPGVRERPETIEAVLIDLLSGPCAQACDGQRPLMLIIDDMEQILVADPAGPHRVAPEHAAVLAAVIRAFHPAETDSRLILTSRFTFRLDGLEDRLQAVHLRPLSTVAQHKLQRRHQALTPTEQQNERAGLAARALTLSRGNPGLQDLIGLRLVYGQQVPVARAEAAVAGMEAYLRQGELPSDAAVRAFLENLALDTLLQEAGPTNHDLLRAATLFDLPVPEPVITVLADQVGGSPTRLRGLGLLEPYPDLYDPTRSALAVNPLAAGRLAPLTPSEQAALAAVSVSALLTAWGGSAPSPGRASGLDGQLTRLGLLADNPTVVAACAADGVHHLRGGRAEEASLLGQDAIALLERHHHAVPLFLLRQTAGAALTSGDGDTGEALLQQAMGQLESGGQDGIDPLDQARVLRDQARRLITRGHPTQAEPLLRQAHHLFTTTGSEREAATAMGYIADIAYHRGDYDEALQIHREIELPVFERLGDTRETAFTWGQIADITYQRGDYDEALQIRREIELPVYERLGDTRSTAITWGQIADITYQRGDYDEALQIRREIELPVYERLGDTRSTAITWGQIAHIASLRGDWESAAELQRRRLEVHKQLGNLDGIAATNLDLARIDLERQDYESAAPRLLESFQIMRHLQRPDGIAIVGLKLAELLLAAGRTDEARQVLGESLAAATTIGSAELMRQINELRLTLPDEGNEHK